ncbi:hypothetical protein [Spirosoma oryzicola]|uniref:hypothetical protein n=1 Tax=Spirosoma oryzicola TaxID=2898794 RepID=UPI001E5743C9|nr:hypothetical protein [Spirosoma oryzicola]UHG91797.1 hypothetical protein LQ777_02600 [Spirosoma oryzicola]
MEAKVNKSERRRMNALLQIALVRADQHRPETSQCYKVTHSQAFFYFESSEGAAVGIDSKESIVDLTDTNEAIIAQLVRAIAAANGESEHHFRSQLLDSVRVAAKAYPDQLRTILETARSFNQLSNINITTMSLMKLNVKRIPVDCIGLAMTVFFGRCGLKLIEVKQYKDASAVLVILLVWLAACLVALRKQNRL